MKILKSLIAVSILSVAGFSFATTCPASDFPPGNFDQLQAPAYQGGMGTMASFYTVLIEPGEDVHKLNCLYTGNGHRITGVVYNISGYALTGPWQKSTNGYVCSSHGTGGDIHTCQFTLSQ
jgi:hypothetical protein